MKITLTTDFNEEVCIDLKERHIKDYNYILYMVDSYTRYTMAPFIKDKKADALSSAFMQTWMAIHNKPVRIYSDNGTVMKEMATKFSIKLKTTVPYYRKFK